MWKRLFRRRIDYSDGGLRRAAQTTAFLFGNTLRGQNVRPEVAKIVGSLRSAGLNVQIPIIDNETLIQEFESRLTDRVFHRIIEVEKETCIGCHSEQHCTRIAFQDRPCLKESPDLGSMSPDRFVGSYEYTPIGVLREVTESLGMPSLVFPPKTGVYVNRGFLINRDGRKRRV